MEESFQNKFYSVVGKPLVIGLFFSFYTIIIRFYVYPKYAPFLKDDVQLIQNFIEWFGVAYGLFIALVLVNVWSQYDTTEREFDREADAIFMLYESAKQVQEIDNQKILKENIIQGIKKYVSHVIENYAKEYQNLKARESGDKILDEIREAIGKLIHTAERESLVSELVEKFHESVDLRGDRISHSGQRIPEPLWGISLASSILWLMPFYGLNFQNDGVAIVLVGGVTAIVVAILVIMKDLDDPFEGTWKINTDEWTLLGEKIELKPTLFFVYNLENNRFSEAWAFIRSFFPNPPCALYALLHTKYQPLSTRKTTQTSNTNVVQRTILGGLASLAYCKITYKDDFKAIYEEIHSLPAVVYKLNSKVEIIMKPTDIKRITTPVALAKRIQKKVISLSDKIQR